MYLRRDIEGLLKRALDAMPVVVLTGPRQAGKSTLLRNHPALAGRRYFTMDDAALRAKTLRESDGLLSGTIPVTIDEAQRVPGLMMAIKRHVDRDRKPGQFLLSGSSNFLLLRNLAENLAGRAVYLRMGPMTWREINDSKNPPLLYRLLRDPDAADQLISEARPVANPQPEDWMAGGFPPAALAKSAEARSFWFTGYRQTYLERDLRDLAQVGDLGLFDQFLQIMALRSAQILNVREIARDCGSNAPTISRWIRLLETGFMGQRIAPYFSNKAKRLVKTPKWYLTDSGIMGHLTGLSAENIRGGGPLRGPIFETYIQQNISSILGDTLPEGRLFHYRSHAGYEVDFVIEHGAARIAVEVKAGSDVDGRDVKGMSALLESDRGCILGLVVYNGSEVRPLGDRMWAVPTGVFLS